MRSLGQAEIESRIMAQELETLAVNPMAGERRA
jgi:hypothetical protein